MNTNEQELRVKANDMAFNDIKDKYGFFTAQFKTIFVKKYLELYDMLSERHFNKLKQQFAKQNKTEVDKK